MDGFTVWLQQFFQSTNQMGTAKLLGSLGVTALILTVSRWFVDRRRWAHYKVAVHDWLERMIAAEKRHPKQLSDDEWKAECERMLVDARFRPTEVVPLLDLAVVVAKAIAANKVVM